MVVGTDLVVIPAAHGFKLRHALVDDLEIDLHLPEVGCDGLGSAVAVEVVVDREAVDAAEGRGPSALVGRGFKEGITTGELLAFLDDECPEEALQRAPGLADDPRFFGRERRVARLAGGCQVSDLRGLGPTEDDVAGPIRHDLWHLPAAGHGAHVGGRFLQHHRQRLAGLGERRAQAFDEVGILTLAVERHHARLGGEHEQGLARPGRTARWRRHGGETPLAARRPGSGFEACDLAAAASRAVGFPDPAHECDRLVEAERVVAAGVDDQGRPHRASLAQTPGQRGEVDAEVGAATGGRRVGIAAEQHVAVE